MKKIILLAFLFIGLGLFGQDTLAYRIESNIVKGSRVVDFATHVLQPNQRFGAEYYHPFYNSGTDAIEEGATAQEIQDILDGVEENSFSAINEQRREDGVTYFTRYNNKILRKRNNATISNAQYISTRNGLRSVFDLVVLGWWDLAQIEIDGMSVPTNPKLAIIFNNAKTRITNYNTNNPL